MSASDAIALLHQREHERDGRQEDQHGQRAVGERVLKAAPQHHARPEDVRHADGVDQPERWQQDERVEQHGHGAGISGLSVSSKVATIGMPSRTA